MRKLFSAIERKDYLREMSQKQLDLLVIGGGITGAGIAWDASVRGMEVGLLEMNDYGSGTSGRSTKLIHGGLRYLKQGEINLVREVGSERALLHKNAPHLVEPIPMLLPIYKKGTYGYWACSLGLYIYDWLAGVKGSERRKMYRRKKTMALEPLFKTNGMKGSGYYYEYRTDDARLTIEIIKSARSHNALMSNYTEVIDFIYKDGKVVGVRAEDRISGTSYKIFARKIVNAAGPWVDHLRIKDKSLKGKRLLLTKGVHLVVNYTKLPVQQAAYFDVPDGRMIFVIPRGKKTYIGTTDTIYKGDPQNPRILEDDLHYLIDAVNAAFPSVQLRPSDIESGWAGLRPLLYEEGKSPSEISRKDEIFVSDSGLITIAGGKLTGFRKMAEKVVDLVAKTLENEIGIVYPPCTTDTEIISGGSPPKDITFEQMRTLIIEEGMNWGLSADISLEWLSRYGSNTREIYRNYIELGGEDVTQEEQLLYSEIQYCIHQEMSVKAVDFLLRRTGWILFDRHRAERLVYKTITYMGEVLGWDDLHMAKEWSLVKEQFNVTNFNRAEIPGSSLESS
jgi:glycerol-3-phosphate dehydrogenase